MKRIVILTVLVFLSAVGLAFAQTTPATTIPSEIKNSITASLSDYDSIEETFMDAFGNTIYGVRNMTSKTKTTKTGTENSTVISENKSTVYSSWHAGSLKTDSVKSNSTDTLNPTSEKISLGTGSSNETYKYDAKGFLSGATGSSENTSIDPEAHTKTTSSATNTYKVAYGEALNMSIHSTGSTIGTGGDATENAIVGGSNLNVTLQTSTSDVANTYKMSGGQIQIMSSATTSTTKGLNAAAGTSSNTTRTVNYSRNANGFCTGISMTMSGQRTIPYGQTGDGTTSGYITQKITSATATSAKDSLIGYYIDSMKVVYDKV